MKKKHFALIGHPIEHTMSPFIHQRLFELSNIDASYEVLNISPYDLKNVFPALQEFDGFNVTLPHKREIIYYLNELSKKGILCGAINTVKNISLKKRRYSIGFTTDPRGFLKSLRESKINLMGKVVILGCGGAARAIAYEVAAAGCETVIAVRHKSLNKATALAGDIYTNILSPNIQTCLISELSGHIDLLINTTPVGMYPNISDCIVEPSIIKNCSNVFDVVYNPDETVLIKTAKSLGVNAVNGISMLVWQAVYSHKIWNNSTFRSDDIKQLCEDTTKEMKRIFYGA